MNIRHLGGSSFHSANESRSKKTTNNNNNALRVTSKHPPSPSSTNRFKKPIHYNQYRLKKRTTGEGDKSDSFVDVLNENRDWMIISKAGNLKERSSNNISFRNQNRKIDLTQSLPNHSNNNFADEFFADSTVVDENGNFIINGKSMDIPGHLNTDEYLKQNYTKLSGNTAFWTAGMVLK